MKQCLSFLAFSSISALFTPSHPSTSGHQSTSGHSPNQTAYPITSATSTAVGHACPKLKLKDVPPNTRTCALLNILRNCAYVCLIGGASLLSGCQSEYQTARPMTTTHTMAASDATATTNATEAMVGVQGETRNAKSSALEQDATYAQQCLQDYLRKVNLAATLGDLHRQYELAVMNITGELTLSQQNELALYGLTPPYAFELSTDLNQGLKQLTSAIRYGSTEAMVFYSSLLSTKVDLRAYTQPISTYLTLHSTGKHQDPTLSKYQAQELTQTARAVLGLSYLYPQSGLNFKPLTAFNYFKDNPHLVAQFGLGRIYIEGLGIKPQLNRGLNLVKQAAAQGYVAALNYLAKLYAEGIYVEQNHSLSLFYAQQATMLLPIAQ